MKIFLAQASVFVILLLFTLSTKAQDTGLCNYCQGDTLTCKISGEPRLGSQWQL